MEKIKDDERVQRRMGDSIQLKREAFLAGDPWINGSVSTGSRDLTRVCAILTAVLYR
jgi:hypothetical protein